MESVQVRKSASWSPPLPQNYVKQYLNYNMCQSLCDKKLLKVVQKLLVWGSGLLRDILYSKVT